MDLPMIEDKVNRAETLSKKFEARINPYVIGKNMTVADFWTFAVYSSVIINPNFKEPKLLEAMQ